MSKTVCDVGDQAEAVAFRIAKQSVYSGDDDLDEVYVCPFVESSDVVGLSDLSFVEDEVDGACMVFNIEPVAHVLTFTVYGKRLSLADVVDEQRNQLLRELLWAVVV